MQGMALRVTNWERHLDSWIPSLAESRSKPQIQEAYNLLSWDRWLYGLFPTVFSHRFNSRHIEFWRFIDSIELGQKPDYAFFAIWPRGGAKTTSAESAVVRLAARNKRRFCLYVRSTQNKANESVQSIAAMLESKKLGEIYPEIASRQLGKYGNAKGWRVDTLRCENGFSVVGLGLDASVRGIKIESERPDLIIFDDIDNKLDTPKTIDKKIETLTNDILPAGSNDVAIIGIQNLVHYDSIFNQIALDKAEFLYNRKVSGPYKAIDGLAYKQKEKGGFTITAGEPTWSGQSLEICEQQINDWGLTAFLQEAQQEVEKRDGGLFAHLGFLHCEWSEIPELVDGAVWCDPAVTTTDQSDKMGIQADGLGVDNKLYRLYSWEQITTPLDCLKRAIFKAVELKFNRVGVETDQGGDLWADEFELACKSLIEDDDYPTINQDTVIPDFVSDKAGAGYGPKVHRWNTMLLDYERGNIVHVIGTHDVLENALYRVPKYKPYDLVDAAFWCWNDLKPGGIEIIDMAQAMRNLQNG